MLQEVKLNDKSIVVKFGDEKMIVLIKGILLIAVIVIVLRYKFIKKESENIGVKTFIGFPQPIILMDNSIVIAQVNFDYSVINKKLFKINAKPVRDLESKVVVFLRNYAENINDKSDLEIKKEEINNNLKNMLVESGQKFGMELTNIYVIFGDKNVFI